MTRDIYKSFEEYEKQEFEFCKGIERAEDLERKIGACNWYRVYRWREANMIKCVGMHHEFAEGSESIRPNKHVTTEEAELIAACSAFWLMQHSRRLWFLESQLSIHGQKEST